MSNLNRWFSKIFTLLPCGEYLGHHTDFECESQVEGQRGQKVQASHAQFDHKPVKFGEKKVFKIIEGPQLVLYNHGSVSQPN